MNLEVNGIFGDLVGSVSKVGILLFLLIHVLFSFMLTKQVNLMTKTLEVGFETVIKNIALLHLLFSIGVFILGFFVL